jgi:hypothetical protein
MWGGCRRNGEEVSRPHHGPLNGIIKNTEITERELIERTINKTLDTIFK